MSLKITIDQEGCIECAACESACPAVFELKPGEKASIVAKYQKGGPAQGEVGDELTACVKEAEESCPVAVIKVET